MALIIVSSHFFINTGIDNSTASRQFAMHTKNDSFIGTHITTIGFIIIWWDTCTITEGCLILEAINK